MTIKKHLFEKKESFRHRLAVELLAEWLNGEIEKPFYCEGKYLFVPDVTVIVNGYITAIYEVVNKNQLSGHKYGLIQYWCYRNFRDLEVYEISADWILDLLKKPDHIEYKENYTVNMFECEYIQDELIVPIN